MRERCEIRTFIVGLLSQGVRLVRLVRLLVNTHIKKQKCKRILTVSHFYTHRVK